MPAHSHAAHELIAVVAGYEDAVVNGVTVRAAAGDVLLFAPGVAHSESSPADPPLDSYFISFALPPGMGHDWPLHGIDAHGRLRQLSRWIFELSSAGSLLSPSAVQQAFLDALIAEFDRLVHERHDVVAQRVRDFIRAHIADRFSLDDLARHAGMSKYHFVRRYREIAGVTPMQEVRMIRLRFARDLILTSDLPIKDIAARSGLGDMIALNHLFKRHFGMTPRGFRRQFP